MQAVYEPVDLAAYTAELASVFRGKSAKMMKPADAERLTGYHVGGISPLGQKRAVPTLIDAGSIDTAEEIHVNGGGRGLQIRLRPADLVAVLRARTAALT